MPDMHADTKYRYYIVEYVGDILGTNSEEDVDIALTAGHKVIDTQMAQVREMVSPKPVLEVKQVRASPSRAKKYSGHDR